MRSFFLFLLCCICGSAQAQVFDQLYDYSQPVELAQPLVWTTVARGSLPSPDAFESTGSTESQGFQPYTDETVLPTSDRTEAWARFALPATATPKTWFVRIPRQTIVKVSLFTRDALGYWQEQSAGEAIAPADWALRTRVPSFELQTLRDSSRVYYLRFQHRNPITERPMLVTPIEYVNGASRVGVVIGVMFGMFGLLAILCITSFAIARKTVFLSFGALVVTLMCTHLILIGYGGWRVWPHSSHLNQVMGWVSTCLTISAAAWFCAQASYSRDSHPWIYRLLVAVAAGSLLMAGWLALDNDFMARSLRNLWIATAIVSVIGSLVWMSLRGQTWNSLLLIGTAPIGLAAMARLFYNVGWIRNVEAAQAAGVVSAQLGLLWILLALAWRSRATLLSRERGTALATYDPTTGLMLPRVLDERLPRMLLRASRQKSGCGVLMLRWLDDAPNLGAVNHEKRSAALSIIGEILRRTSRDVDTVVRYDDDVLMMLVEGPISRTSVSEISTQILASCLRAAEKLGDPNALNLHIAIWHDSPGALTAQQVIEILKTRLHQMSYGTRRPVQFVDAASEHDSHPNEDSERRKQELLDKINAIETAGMASAKTGT
ncbi:MAG: diguanylate cyclase [Polaromonas sp.]|nr:diguanylate cyclase [Polaromonas sp.]